MFGLREKMGAGMREEYLNDRQSRADAAILGSSGYLELARREYEKNPQLLRMNGER